MYHCTYNVEVIINYTRCIIIMYKVLSDIANLIINFLVNKHSRETMTEIEFVQITELNDKTLLR